MFPLCKFAAPLVPVKYQVVLGVCDACVMCRVLHVGRVVSWWLYCCVVVSYVCLLCRLWVHAFAVYTYIYTRILRGGGGAARRGCAERQAGGNATSPAASFPGRRVARTSCGPAPMTPGDRICFTRPHPSRLLRRWGEGRDRRGLRFVGKQLKHRQFVWVRPYSAETSMKGGRGGGGWGGCPGFKGDSGSEWDV